MAKKPTGAAPRGPHAADTAAPSGAFAGETNTKTAAVALLAAPASHDTTTQVETTRIEVQASMEKAVKSAEEFMSFSQGNFEALVQSGQIWAAGVQDLGKAMSATAQAQAEAAMGTFKALSGVKSLKEAMDLQATLARSSFETAMAETGKITEASVKLAEQAMAPITARVTLAVEKFGRVA